MEKFEDRSLNGVFHCFTGNAEQGNKITGLGFYLGIGGVTTFKNSGMDKVIPSLDKSRLILETDSPYLSPAPKRGERNEPWKVSLIAGRVAELLEVRQSEVEEFTSQNAKNLFFDN